RKAGPILTRRAVHDDGNVSFSDAAQHALQAGRHALGKRAIEHGHGLEHAFRRGGPLGGVATERAYVELVFPGERSRRSASPFRRFFAAFVGAPQIADRADAERIQRAMVAIGDVAEHAGTEHPVPFHDPPVVRAIAADVSKVAAALEGEGSLGSWARRWDLGHELGAWVRT